MLSTPLPSRMSPVPVKLVKESAPVAPDTSKMPFTVTVGLAIVPLPVSASPAPASITVVPV